VTAPADPSAYPAREAVLTVDGLSLRVRASARRKRFALTVETDATLTLHTPAGRSTAEAELFVRAHRDWLLTKRREQERTRPLTPSSGSSTARSSATWGGRTGWPCPVRRGRAEESGWSRGAS
jgi:hypothetical protein